VDGSTSAPTSSVKPPPESGDKPRISFDETIRGAHEASSRMGVTHTTRFANFHQEATLMGGQDAIISGGARLKDGLSMTFGLT
jgi:hypothetical protein